MSVCVGLGTILFHLRTEEAELTSGVLSLMRHGQIDAVKPLVGGLVLSRRVRSVVLTTCTQLDSLAWQPDLQAAQLKVTLLREFCGDHPHHEPDGPRRRDADGVAGLAEDVMGKVFGQIAPQADTTNSQPI